MLRLVSLALLAFQIFSFSALANDICKTVYLNRGHPNQPSLIASFESRLKKYFGSEWIKGDLLSDAEAAKQLIKKLEIHGTNLDFKVFDIYLKILESTAGKFEVRVPGFYIDMLMGLRPKSNHFQERHWDWNILDGYFFNTPLSVPFSKEHDLLYLEHVYKTARAMGKSTSLPDVLKEANSQWATRNLDFFPGLVDQFRHYQNGKTNLELYSEFKVKVQDWIAKAPSLEERKTRIQKVQSTLQAFRSSHSNLDLLILERYFDLAIAYQFTAGHSLPNWLQMTDWRVFEMGVSNPNIGYLTDFLFQNSHDIVAKGYLLSILNAMKPALKKRGKLTGSFYFEFLNARQRVDSQLLQRSPPEIYQSDLHIFSKSLSPGNSEPDFLDHTLVSWNSTLGRLQTNIVDSLPFASNKNATVASNPRLNHYIRDYFDNFRKNKTYSDKEIDHDEHLELNSPLVNSTFLVFAKHERDQMLTMIRIFDGSKSPTFIEREFTHISLPGRENGESLFELGRLLGNKEIEPNSFALIMARVADYFKSTNSKGIVYIDANEAGMKLYKRNGFEIVYTPEELQIKPEATPMWVMKLSVEEIIDRFLKPDYASVKARVKN